MLLFAAFLGPPNVTGGWRLQLAAPDEAREAPRSVLAEFDLGDC